MYLAIVELFDANLNDIDVQRYLCFQISHTTSGRVLGSNQLTFSSDGTNATFRVMFKDPVEILPATNYTASATLKVNSAAGMNISS